MVLIHDPEVTRWVETATDHLDEGHSCRRVVAWLVEKTGKKISHQGITNIWKEHRGPNSDKPSKLLKEREKARKKAPPKGRQAKKIAATKRKQSDAKRVRLWDFYPDPDACNMSEAEFSVQRHRLNRTQMRELKKRPFFRDESIKLAINYCSNFIREYWGDSLDDSGLVDSLDRYEVLEYWVSKTQL